MAGRQLAEETESHAKERLVEIEAEATSLRQKLASLREQWEAEKSGVGSAQELRQKLEEAQLAFDQVNVQVNERQSLGQAVSEEMYQKLYELDVARKQLASRLEQEEAEKEAAEKDAEKEKKPAKRSFGVRLGQKRLQKCEFLDGYSRYAAC